MAKFSIENVEAFARENHIPVMLKGTKELLAKTVESANPKSILEIGTAIGYSGCVMLSEAKEAHLNTIEMDEESIKIAKNNFALAGFSNRVTVFAGDAKDIVKQLTGKYDFIFLDGPKGQYLYFMPYLLDVLEDGGILFCDNVLFYGLVENIPANNHKKITIARNLHKFLELLQENENLETEIFKVGDGVSISRKNK